MVKESNICLRTLLCGVVWGLTKNGKKDHNAQ